MNMDMNVGNLEQFIAGLRVLLVDYDQTCLMILEKMLRTCHYQVTTSNRAEKALSLLRENKKGYDIIISDVHMPDMDGFKLLEHVGLEMDLPVIVISANDSKSVVMKGITCGACDYLIKPVRIEALKNIWQHVVRRNMNEWKEFEQSGSIAEGDRQQKPNGVSQHHTGLGTSFMGPRDAASGSKSSINNLHLHAGHLQAATLARSLPKSSISMPILDQRNNIFSFENLSNLRFGDSNSNSVNSNNQVNLLHGIATSMKPKQLAKFRGMNMQQNSRGKDSLPNMMQMDNSNNPHLSRMSASAPIVHKPVFSTNGGFAHSELISNVRASGFGHNELISNVRASGYNPLTQTSPTVGFSSSLDNMGKGSPQNVVTSKESPGFESGYDIFNDLAQHKTTNIWDLQDLQNVNVSNMGKGLLQNESASKESQGFELGDDIFNDLAQHETTDIWELHNVDLRNMGNECLQNEGTSKELQGFESGYDMVFNNLAQNKTTDISDLQNVNLSNMGKGLLQNEGISKELQGFESGYGIFSNLAQHKTMNNWDLQNIGLTFESTPHTNLQGTGNNLNMQPSVLVHQGFSSSQNGARNIIGNGIGYPNMGRQFNTFIGENSLGLKSELTPEFSSQNLQPSHQFEEEDILGVIIKLQEQKEKQEGIQPVPNDFSIDCFPPSDDLPV